MLVYPAQVQPRLSRAAAALPLAPLVLLTALLLASPAAAQLTLPHTEGFESANSATYTTAQNPVPGLTGVEFKKTNNARLRTAYTSGIRTGSRSITMDSSSGYSRGDVIVKLDLSNYTGGCSSVSIDFWFREYADEPHSTQSAGTSNPPLVGETTTTPADANDWVYIRGSNTDDWVLAYNWGASASSTFQKVTLNVGTLLSGASPAQSISSTTELMFRWYDNSGVTGDGVAFDDITVTETNTCSTLSGRVGIDGKSGGFGVLGSSDAEFPASVQLELQDGVCAPAVNCPTTTTNSSGAYSFPNLLTGTYTIDVRDTDIPLGFVLEPGTTSVGATAEPMTSISVTNPTNKTMNFAYVPTAPSLPLKEGFEGAGNDTYTAFTNRLAGLSNVYFGDEDGTSVGRLRTAVGSAFYHGGDNAATVDTTTGSIADTEVILSYDLSAFDTATDTVMLEFWWMDHADENNWPEFVSFRASSNANWSQIYDRGVNSQDTSPPANIAPNDGIWQQVTVDLTANHLSPVSGAPSNFTKSFQLRFHQRDNAQTTSTTGGDGVTWDDICIYLQGGADCSGSEIGNRIWNDLDGDAVDDPGEPGIPGLTVTLRDDAGNQLDQTTTDAQGAYSFITSLTGTFRVVITPPAGANNTSDPDGGICTSQQQLGVCDHETTLTIAAPGEVHTDRDFGYLFTGSIAGTVLDDRDGDTVADPGEGGIAGLTVELRQGAVVHQVTTTDANGDYSFVSVGPATWTTVITTAPAGATPTFDPDDASAPVSTAHQSVYTLPFGQQKSAYDFGYQYQGSISGRLWDDQDANQVQNGAEPGIVGATLTLKNGADTHLIVTTDANGDYSFTAIPGATWDVIVTRPPGGLATFDPDATLDNQTQIVLAAGGTSTAQNFGYDIAPAIGGRVWNDTNQNGIVDSGEAGYDGIDLELRDGTCTPGTNCPVETTAGGGFYEFRGLSAGIAYVILIDECTLPISGVLTTSNVPYNRTLAANEIVGDANFGYRAQTLPVVEGFEGALDRQAQYTANSCVRGAPGFDFAHDNVGRLRLQAGEDFNTSHPEAWKRARYYYRNGLASALLDTATGGQVSQNDLTLSLDLSDLALASDELLLDYSVFDHSDEGAAGDKVEMRVGTMAAGLWVEVEDWGAADRNEVWTDVANLNLSQVLRDYNTANGTSHDFDSGFQVRWRQVDNNPATQPSWSDGLSVDDIWLRLGTGTAHLGGQVWKDLDNDVTLDPGEGAPCLLVELYDDTNGNGVLDGVEGNTVLRTSTAAADGSYEFPALAAGDYLVDINSDYLPHQTNVVGAPFATTLSAGQQVTASNIELSGRVVLPYSQGFEDATDRVYFGDTDCLNGLPDFSFSEPDTPTTVGYGRVNFIHSAAHVKTGNRAATLDGGPFSSLDDEEELILTLDMSNYDITMPVTLDFQMMPHSPFGSSFMQEAKVFIRGSKSDAWLELYDLENTRTTNDQGTYKLYSALDLSDTLCTGAGASSPCNSSSPVQDFSSSFQIKWWGSQDLHAEVTYNDRQGGYSIDDITINGPGASVIGDMIYNDLDGDSTRDAGEPGIPGLSVLVKDSNGDIAATDTTAANGSYQLSVSGLGNHTIEVTPPAGATPTEDPDGTGTPNKSVYNVPFQGSFTDAQDFGYQFSGSIAGKVFQDANGNGTQNGVEPDWSGLTVELRQGATTYFTTTTNGSGAYSFTGLSPATWTVVVTRPTGTIPTVDPDGIATPDAYDVALAASQAVSGATLGYRYNGSIGGYLWSDDNLDGVQDPGEDPLVGLEVELQDGASNPIGVAQTSATGAYLFEHLPPNGYILLVAPPPGFLPTWDRDGSPDNTTAVALGAGQTVQDADFGYQTPELVGTVYHDVDGNGSFGAGDVTLANVDLTLLGPGCNPCSATTDGSGDYRFAGIAPSNYSLNVDLDTVVLSGQPKPKNPGALPATITLAPGSNTQNVGFEAEDLPGVTCTTDNDYYYDFTGIQNMTYGSGAGPFSGTIIGAPDWKWETEDQSVPGWSYSDGRIFTGENAIIDRDGSDPIQAITLHSQGWASKWVTLQLDLSPLGSSDLLLDFSWTDHGDDATWDDRLEVRGTTSDPWIRVQNFYPERNPDDQWIDFADINLASFLEANGQSPGATFQLRFGHRGQYLAALGTGYDGTTMDNVCLRTGNVPDTGDLIGFVFRDYDADGERDDDEAPYAGVEIEITGPGCSPCTRTTDEGGRYTFEDLTLGNYTLNVTSVPGGGIQTKARRAPTNVVVRGGISTVQDFGFQSTLAFTENTVMTAKSKAIWFVDPTTGSARKATDTIVEGINSLAANPNSCQVYYGVDKSLYRWDVISDTHHLISDLGVDYAGTFTGQNLDSSGATYWPPTDTLYLGAEGGPAGSFDAEGIYKITMGSGGTAITSLTRIDIQNIAATDPETPHSPVGGFGDFVAFDNGSGGVRLFGSTQNNNPKEIYWWTYDDASGDYVHLRTLGGGSKMYQLGRTPSGTIFSGQSYILQRMSPVDGTLLGDPIEVPATFHINDMTGFISGCLAQIGSAKRVVTGPTNNGDGTWTVGFRVRVENHGVSNLFDVQLADTLDVEFGTHVVGVPAAPGQYTVSAAPNLSATSGGAVLTANAAFDGSGDQNLLTLNGGDSLPIGATADVDFSIRFFPVTTKSVFYNQVLAAADTAENGTTEGETDDLSDNGADPDPGDGSGGAANDNPEDSDEDDPTPVAINTGYDLAMTYTYVSDTSLDGISNDARARSGDEITFMVTLINQGTTAVTNPVLRAYVDSSLFANFRLGDNPNAATGGTHSIPYTWAVSGGHGLVTLNGSLPGGGSVTLPVTLTLTSNAQGTKRAYVEVYSDNGADVDSTPESEELNNNGDPLVLGVTDGTGGDEDDHDASEFVIPGGGIGDFIWHDINNNGSQNGSEPGIGGVTVRLYRDDGTTPGVLDGGDTLIATTVSDGNGGYAFFGLEEATYIVDPDETTMSPGFSPSFGATGVSGPIVLVADTFNDTVDFGYTNAGSSAIGDFVWYDTDGDGEQDPGEIGFKNIGVGVTGPGGYNQATTTDSAGLYLVTGVTQSGTYTVTINTASLPAGVNPVPTNQPSASAPHNVLNPQDYLRADYGFNGGNPGTIGDLVFRDLDNDGVRDVGEPGIGNVTVDLTDGSGVHIATTTTAVDGSYDFSGVFPGTYQVVVTDTNGALFDVQLCAGSSPTGNIGLLAGQDYNGADFGYCPNEEGLIGDLVFHDQDGDGFFDPDESGIELVELELWRDENNDCILQEGFDTLLRTTKTDEIGRYRFQVLDTPEDYLVRPIVTQPVLAPMTQTIGSIGSDEYGQPSPYCAQLTLASPTRIGADFGFRTAAGLLISGTVFKDAEANGVYEPQVSDEPVPNATVTLYRDLNSNGEIDAEDPRFGQVITPANGYYAFTSLPGGTKWIVTSQVTNTVVSGGVQTTQTTTGGKEPVELQPVRNSTGHDFGYTTSPTLALITSFKAYDEGDVVVEWTTSSELGTLGFQLYRTSGGEWVPVGDYVASPGEPLGATYRVADPGASTSGMLEYALVEVEPRGGSRTYGPFQVFAQNAGRSAGTALGATARPRTGIHLDRQQARRVEARRPLENPNEVGTALKMTVLGGGVYSVSAATIADGLGIPLDRAEDWIAQGLFRLRRDLRVVDWWSNDGTSIQFYAPEANSLYTANVDVYLEQLSGRTARAQLLQPVAPVDGSTFLANVRQEDDVFGATAAARSATEEFWFWRVLGTFGNFRSTTIDFDLRHHTGEGPASVEVSVFGATDSERLIDHSFNLFLNDRLIDTVEWSGAGHRQFAFDVAGSDLLEYGNELRIEAEIPTGIGIGVFYLDAVEITHERDLMAENGQLEFFADEPVSTITGFDSQSVQVLDITDRYRPIRIGGATVDYQNSYRVTFPPTAGHTYLATEASAVENVTATPITPLQTAGAEYVVVAPRELSAAAERLADLRRARGLTAEVYAVEDIYDGLSGGIEDPEAIHGFLENAWVTWDTKPRFVALVGKGTFDYEDTKGLNSNLIPPPLVASASGLFSADRIIGDVVGDDLRPEVAVGRIPVLTEAELDAYIDKLALWESGQNSGSNRITLVADNPDNAGNFSETLDVLEGTLQSSHEANRIELAELGLVEAKSRLQAAFNEGSFLVSYAGHGGLDRIAAEGMMTLSDLGSLTASGQIPIVSAMTCTLNRFEVPGLTSLGEALVLDPDGGAIAVFAPSGLSENLAAQDLGEQLLEEILSGGAETLGEAVLAGLHSGDVNPKRLTSYTLLGDPALVLPEQVIDEEPDVLFEDDFESGSVANWITRP